MTKQVVTMDFNGKTYTLETGRIAKQAHGAVLASCGETVVLATVVASDKPREGVDFFPLTVDYTEKLYAAGKIPGGFFKREARPSTKETLTARLTDRPIRPLFPEGFRNDVNITITVLSYDGINMPDHLGMVAASAALSVSKIPFMGPIGAVVVGLIDDKLVINPSFRDMERSKLELAIAGTRDAIMMVESEAKEISEEKMIEALLFGHRELAKLIDLQEDLVKKAGQPKMAVELALTDKELNDKITKMIKSDLEKALFVLGKKANEEAVKAVKTKMNETLLAEFGEDKFAEKAMRISECFNDLEKEIVRTTILNDRKRCDGRKFDEIRPISIETGVLPRTHGSALFTRGETQALVLATLGTALDEQMIDGLEETYTKKFYLHYNFPPYSVGEIGKMKGPGRRELGHGNLAERALKSMLPSPEVFPYTIRVVSEITESNGSSSMASVCGGTLSLMDAGVPLKSPVAGIAMGLIKTGEKYAVLTDIMGVEDHLGDMDFKVTGTKDGITALQMDIKIAGINEQIMTEALAQAKKARFFLLDKMQQVIAQPNKISQYAPKIEAIMVPIDRIGEVIGPGGKVIKKIQEIYDVVINIEDSGKCSIASMDQKAIDGARNYIQMMLKEIEVGEVYDGTVVKLMNFGAFVEVGPGKEGLVHISEIDNKRVERVEDYLQEGQAVRVKCIKIDEKGRVNFTMKNI
jgi:polyribonucleotide nucleotidyltransferase